MNWHTLSFAELTTTQLYQLLKLRVEVFVVEQNCPYPELDDKDILPHSHHLLGYDAQQQLVAYARLLAPGVSYPGCSIGRILVAESARGQQLGQQLVEQAIHCCHTLWPDTAIEIGAQHYLQAFYQRLGFQPTSAVYLEDDIPHLDMRLA